MSFFYIACKQGENCIDRGKETFDDDFDFIGS